MSVADEIHRVTVDEYVHIVRDLGWESTELLEGVVYDVAPEFNRHAETVDSVFRQVDRAFDPDDAVPASGLKLAVEVSVTTQARDRGPTLIAYAKAGVPEVWLIDPRPEVADLVRYREPSGASYRTVDRFAIDENASNLDVAAILHH